MSLVNRLLLSLLLLALSLRALIPLGYMPDAQALREGRLQITFCSAAGGAPTLLHAFARAPQALSSEAEASQGHAHHMAMSHGEGGPGHALSHPASVSHESAGHHTDGSAQECPFWMVAHQALDVPSLSPAVLPGAAVAGMRVLHPVDRALPPLPAAGPPLGPRGPPLLFA